MVAKNAVEALNSLLQKPPYNKGSSIIVAGSNESRARALVVTPPNPDLKGNCRNLVIDVDTSRGSPSVRTRYLPMRIA